MSDSDQAEQPERRGKNAVAFLASLTFHVGLLLVLALTAITAGKRSQGLLINASAGKSDATSLDNVQTFELSPDTADLEESFDLEPQFELDLEIQSAFTDVGQSGGDALTLTSVNVDSLSKKLQQQGNEPGASFFGAYAPGNRFVYVLDSSRSMEGDRWLYARSQLLDSIRALKPNQEFFVICFDLQTSFLFTSSPDLVKFYNNDDKTIDRVRNWLRGRQLGRSTMPAQALTYALSYNPDAIFLLSDGELRDNSRFLLHKINSNTSSTRQIPIHTIHLFSAEGRETLQMIARENAGTFTPIETKRLSRRRR